MEMADLIEAGLGRVRDRFVATLGERLAEVEAAVPDAACARPAASAEALRMTAHRIAGLAPSVGFERLGAIAARIEDRMEAGAGLEALSADIDLLRAEMQAILEAARG